MFRPWKGPWDGVARVQKVSPTAVRRRGDPPGRGERPGPSTDRPSPCRPAGPGAQRELRHAGPAGRGHRLDGPALEGHPEDGHGPPIAGREVGEALVGRHRGRAAPEPEVRVAPRAVAHEAVELLGQGRGLPVQPHSHEAGSPAGHHHVGAGVEEAPAVAGTRQEPGPGGSRPGRPGDARAAVDHEQPHLAAAVLVGIVVLHPGAGQPAAIRGVGGGGVGEEGPPATRRGGPPPSAGATGGPGPRSPGGPGCRSGLAGAGRPGCGPPPRRPRPAGRSRPGTCRRATRPGRSPRRRR